MAHGPLNVQPNVRPLKGKDHPRPDRLRWYIEALFEKDPA